MKKTKALRFSLFLSVAMVLLTMIIPKFPPCTPLYSASSCIEDSPSVEYVLNDSYNLHNTYFYCCTSSHSSIAIDSQDNPHIVWDDNDCDYSMSWMWKRVSYIHWDGEEWVTADGEVWDPKMENGGISLDNANSGSSCIVLDSNDYPHISWINIALEPFSVDIIYIYWNGEEWLTVNGEVWNPETGNANVVNSENMPSDLSLQIDSDSNPHIVWSGGGPVTDSIDVFYIHWDGEEWVTADGEVWDPKVGNANVSNDDDNSVSPCLALDKSNDPHIVWCDENEFIKQVVYVKWSDKQWKTIDGNNWNPKMCNGDISENTDDSINPVLKFDSNDNPHV